MVMYTRAHRVCTYGVIERSRCSYVVLLYVCRCSAACLSFMHTLELGLLASFKRMSRSRTPSMLH